MYDFEEFYNIGEELSKIDDEAHIRSAIIGIIMHYLENQENI